MLSRVSVLINPRRRGYRVGCGRGFYVAAIFHSATLNAGGVVIHRTCFARLGAPLVELTLCQNIVGRGHRLTRHFPPEASVPWA